MSMLKTDVTVADVMLPIDRFPCVPSRELFKQALEKMNEKKLGIVCILNPSGKLLGVLTDGDIRRNLLTDQKPLAALFVDDALEHAELMPLTVLPQLSLALAVQIMEEKQVWDLPVVDSAKTLVGLLHLHPAVKALLSL